MSYWFESEELNAGSFHSLKVGETVTMTVKDVVRNTTGDAKYMLKRKDGSSLGFSMHFIDTNDRTLNVNTFVLMGLLKKEKIVPGDQIEIRHLEGKGNYELNVLKKVPASQLGEATEEDGTN